VHPRCEVSDCRHLRAGASLAYREVECEHRDAGGYQHGQRLLSVSFASAVAVAVHYTGHLAIYPIILEWNEVAAFKLLPLLVVLPTTKQASVAARTEGHGPGSTDHNKVLAASHGIIPLELAISPPPDVSPVVDIPARVPAPCLPTPRVPRDGA
jgi:hypothetical protein